MAEDKARIKIATLGELAGNPKVVRIAEEIVNKLRDEAKGPMEAGMIMAIVIAFFEDVYGLKMETVKLPPQQGDSIGHHN
jgi:hypothetical protein